MTPQDQALTSVDDANQQLPDKEEGLDNNYMLSWLHKVALGSSRTKVSRLPDSTRMLARQPLASQPGFKKLD
jgi:hypothetical protein